MYLLGDDRHHRRGVLWSERMVKDVTSGDPTAGRRGHKGAMSKRCSGGLTLRRQEREPCVILLLVPILLMIWVYYGKQAGFDRIAPLVSKSANGDVYRTAYEYLAAFGLMFAIPALIAKGVFGRRLRDLGVCLGDTTHGFRFVVLALPAFVLVAYLASRDAAVQAEYPLAKGAMLHLPWFLALEAFYLVYYVGWEFLFRGFLLFGLEEEYGAVLAILVQTIPSTIVHIGKPASEAFGAIAAGLLFGYLAIRTRSILYPLLLHAVVGIGTDVFLTLRML
jgi:membrane protease YdiL (CAAX protease family)